MMEEKEKREINVDIRLSQLEAVNGILKDSVKQQGDTIRGLKHIIIVLIVAFSVVLAAGIGGFFWYESQFEIVESDTTEMYTEGDNANINNVEGNQYNDSAQHHEGMVK